VSTAAQFFGSIVFAPFLAKSCRHMFHRLILLLPALLCISFMARNIVPAPERFTAEITSGHCGGRDDKISLVPVSSQSVIMRTLHVPSGKFPASNALFFPHAHGDS
jgi:hypothetical protein